MRAVATKACRLAPPARRTCRDHRQRQTRRGMCALRTVPVGRPLWRPPASGPVRSPAGVARRHLVGQRTARHRSQAQDAVLCVRRPCHLPGAAAPPLRAEGSPFHPRPLRGITLRVALRGVADNHPSIVPMVTTIGMNIATIKTIKKKAAATKTATFTANVFVLFATCSSLKMRAAISPPNNKT